MESPVIDLRLGPPPRGGKGFYLLTDGFMLGLRDTSFFKNDLLD